MMSARKIVPALPPDVVRLIVCMLPFTSEQYRCRLISKAWSVALRPPYLPTSVFNKSDLTIDETLTPPLPNELWHFDLPSRRHFIITQQSIFVYSISGKILRTVRADLPFAPRKVESCGDGTLLLIRKSFIKGAAVFSLQTCSLLTLKDTGVGVVVGVGGVAVNKLGTRKKPYQPMILDTETGQLIYRVNLARKVLYLFGRYLVTDDGVFEVFGDGKKRSVEQRVQTLSLQSPECRYASVFKAHGADETYYNLSTLSSARSHVAKECENRREQLRQEKLKKQREQGSSEEDDSDDSEASEEEDYESDSSEGYPDPPKIHHSRSIAADGMLVKASCHPTHLVLEAVGMKTKRLYQTWHLPSLGHRNDAVPNFSFVAHGDTLLVEDLARKRKYLCK